MTGRFVWFILSVRVIHVVSECTETFLFEKISVDSKLTYYLDSTILDSKLVCSKMCQDNKYCTGFSYNLYSGRCELYDEVISNAKTEVANGTVTYKGSGVCGPPPSISNTNTQPSNPEYLAGHLMLYDCIPNTYQDTSIVCLNDGTWNTSVVNCQYYVCGPPPSIPNTNTQPSNPEYLPDHLMLYDCIPNTYQNTSIVCLNDGTWNTSAVSCQYGKTCDDAAFHGVSFESTLLVEPLATSSPIIVKCEYNGSNYWTVIDTTWDNTSIIQGHRSRRSGVYNVSYSISLNYISAIADLSTFCTQYMKAICRHSHLMNDNGWRTRDGSLADYFFGGIKGQMNCACHLNNSCYDNASCNCNANVAGERHDEGFSTYKDDLPVTAFLSGDTDGSGEYYYVHISSLRCTGISPVD